MIFTPENVEKQLIDIQRIKIEIYTFLAKLEMLEYISLLEEIEYDPGPPPPPPTGEGGGGFTPPTTEPTTDGPSVIIPKIKWEEYNKNFNTQLESLVQKLMNVQIF